MRRRSPARRRKLFRGAAFTIAALNLRPTIAAVSPVLQDIRRTTGLTDVGLALLTTLPLVCFGLLAPAAPGLVRRFGTGAVLLSCVGLLVAGTILRSVGLVGLFAGTVVLGVGIAVANVLIPGIVKEDFPERAGLMTGMYTMALSAGPAAAAGLSAPLTHALGGDWRLSTALWALPGAAAFFVLLPLRSHRRPSSLVPAPRHTGLWRDPVAWAVTLFMGLQSLEFYSALAWLPTIFSSHGLSADAAGGLLAATNLVGIVAALFTPAITERLPDTRIAIFGCVGFLAAGTAGLIFAPGSLQLLWAALLGLGQGSAISLAILLMVLRSHDPQQAMRLSGMSQGVGYLIAALGPAMTGALHQIFGGWTIPLSVLLGILGLMAASGYIAGRNGKIGPAEVQMALEESGSLEVR